MTDELDNLVAMIRRLKLEEEQLELEKRIAHLKSEQLIDEGCVGCAGPCNVVDVAANLQKELDEAHGILASKDRVLVNLHKTIHDFKAIETQETDRLHKIIEELKDRNIEDMHELYDLYEDELRGIKADRTSIKSDRDIMFQNYRNTVAKLQADIKGLEVELSDLAEYKRYSDLRKCADDKTIECLEAELSARKGDSEVLMKVVDVANRWSDEWMASRPAMNQIAYLVKDYHDAPEGPPETPIDDLYKVTVTYAFLEMP